MSVNHIGITGHRPNFFRDAEKTKELCDSLVLNMLKEYDHPIFNLGGCAGADQWVGNACIKYNIEFNLFLPFPAEIQSKYWYKDQQEALENQIKHCKGLVIAGPKYKPANFFIRNRSIVDNSDFLVCFWEGMHRGGTYDCIKYAVQKKSKIVLNALTDLSMVTGEELILPKKQ